jgi:hypothetical protein
MKIGKIRSVAIPPPATGGVVCTPTKIEAPAQEEQGRGSSLGYYFSASRSRARAPNRHGFCERVYAALPGVHAFGYSGQDFGVPIGPLGKGLKGNHTRGQHG